MKASSFIGILFLLTILVGCWQNDQSSELNLHSRSVKLDIAKGNSLFDFFAVDRIISLESGENAYMGSISSVKWKQSSHSYLIGDIRSAKKVWLYNDQGNIVFQLGDRGQGPGEYEEIVDFGFWGEGKLFILDRLKLCIFDIQGHHVKDIQLSSVAKEAEVLNENLVIYQDRELEGTHTLTVIGPDFNDKLGSMRQADCLSAFPIRDWSTMSVLDNRLFFMEPVSMNLYSFSEDGMTEVFHLPALPGQGVRFDSNHYSFQDIKKVLMNNHRCIFNGSTESVLFFIETYSAEKIYRLGVFIPSKGYYQRFDGVSLAGQSRKKPGFTRIVGTWSEGIVLSCENSSDISFWNNKYPNKLVLEHPSSDNPELIFLKQITQGKTS
jgi:hypothetical protein